jgi:hypothetical protein
MKRRDFVKTAGIGSAALMSFPVIAHAVPGRVLPPSTAKKGQPPAETFLILLEGLYEPVERCDDLGLSGVDLCDGSYSTTLIYPVSGLDAKVKKHGNGNGDKPIGKFYVQFAGMLAVYDLPDGAIKMEFTGSDVKEVPDGQGGVFIVGTFELAITDATGIYQSFIGGHNTMVDVLHGLGDGNFVEHCYCNISH